MRNRITKNLITTVLGVIVVLGSVTTVFFHGISWTEAGAGIGIGVGLIMMKDPKKKTDEPNI